LLIQYYGARGSLPTPGKGTVKYGGNTTCLSLLAGKHQYIVDAGSGLRLLGLELMKQEFARGQGEAVFFWTHFHWDHLMGFPFFVPNFIRGNRFVHYGSERVRELLVRQQDFVTFPVEFDKMPTQHEFRQVQLGQTLQVDGLEVSTCRMNHPAGGFTYRFRADGKSLVFATDVEHLAEGLDPELLALSNGADLLIYDAQYTPEEYAAGKQGWGHSTWRHGVELARAAKVKRLHLCHHDQLHTDRFLETKILAPARRLFPKTHLAREGWKFEL
jgi:phosphoribosyl 1,2-cyclic phosphodiesterase